MNLTVHALARQIGGAEFGRREEQVRFPVDRDAEFLFRPGLAAVVTAQAGLDVGQRNPSCDGRQCTAKRTRRVALDDNQGRRDVAKQRKNRLRDDLNVRERVGLPGARQPQRRKTVETVVDGIERRMLAREKEGRLKSAPAERGSYWLELDGFGTCTDDQNNATGQPSP